MKAHKSKTQEDAYFKVLKLLNENPDLTQREIANIVGLSYGGASYCIRALIEKGFVKVQNFTHSKNKFGYVYILTPSGIAQKIALTSSYLKRKIQEYEDLNKEIKSIQQEISDINRQNIKLDYYDSNI